MDLNVIRAGMADTPEASDHTSIQRRLQALKSVDPDNTLIKGLPYRVASNPQNFMPDGLRFTLSDCVALVEWTARQIHPYKTGHIAAGTPPMLDQLDIELDN